MFSSGEEAISPSSSWVWGAILHIPPLVPHPLSCQAPGGQGWLKVWEWRRRGSGLPRDGVSGGAFRLMGDWEWVLECRHPGGSACAHAGPQLGSTGVDSELLCGHRGGWRLECLSPTSAPSVVFFSVWGGRGVVPVVSDCGSWAGFIWILLLWKSRPLSPDSWIESRRQSFGRREKNSFIALRGKGSHSRLIP